METRSEKFMTNKETKVESYIRETFFWNTFNPFSPAFIKF